MADGERWFFGVLCSRCGGFIPVGRDPSDGNPKLGWPTAGAIFAVCPACHQRDVYASIGVTRRQVDEHAAKRHA